MALAVPLLIGAVPPNPFYGFRLAPVFDNECIWYATNRYAAKWMLGTGLSMIATAVALYLVPGITIDLYAIACLAAAASVLILGVVLSWRYAQKMKENCD